MAVHSKYTDDWKHTKLLSGQPLHFPQSLSADMRWIPFDWLEEATSKGVKIDIEHAVIDGFVGNFLPLDLKYFIFTEEVCIKDSEVLEAIDFSHAMFQRLLNLEGTTFNKRVKFYENRVGPAQDIDSAT